jgi:alpha-glucosidase
MQWDASSAQAGFSSNPHTWLPVTADYRTVNVQTEAADPGSLLKWYRRLIALRRSNRALRSGRTVMLERTNPNVLSYARVSDDGDTIIVSLNMSPQPQQVTLGLAQAGVRGSHLETLLSSPGPPPDGASASSPQTLPAYAAWVAGLRSRNTRAAASEPGRGLTTGSASRNPGHPVH